MKYFPYLPECVSFVKRVGEKKKRPKRACFDQPTTQPLHLLEAPDDLCIAVDTLQDVWELGLGAETLEGNGICINRFARSRPKNSWIELEH